VREHSPSKTLIGRRFHAIAIVRTAQFRGCCGVSKGVRANPAGLITHYQGDLTYESDSLAYLDINAIAVRERDSVPDRPIRFTFRCETNGVFAQWKLMSVLELPPGVPSKALDREPNLALAEGRGEVRKTRVL
jgi:hypothetical protein